MLIDDASLEREKSALRRRMTAVRKACADSSPSAAAELAARIGREFQLPESAVVAGFHAYRTEIDPLPAMRHFAGKGHRLCLPVVVAKAHPLIFRSWREGDPMMEGAYGIPVPLSNAETLQPDMLIVPMLAFDTSGYRLGYGGGFYDRTLDALRRDGRNVVAVGVAYDGQEAVSVPHQATDQPLDVIITDKRVIRPSAAGPGVAS